MMAQGVSRGRHCRKPRHTAGRVSSLSNRTGLRGRLLAKLQIQGDFLKCRHSVPFPLKGCGLTQKQVGGAGSPRCAPEEWSWKVGNMCVESSLIAHCSPMAESCFMRSQYSFWECCSPCNGALGQEPSQYLIMARASHNAGNFV